MKKALTFDDVALVPQYNNVASRTEPDLSTWLTTKIKIGMPLLAANMDTVIGNEMAEELLRLGGFPIFHRFTTNELQLGWAKRFCQDSKAALSVGMIEDLHLPYQERVKELFIEKLIVEGKVNVLCIDIAHGHCKKMLEQIDWLKRTWPELQIIAGNVCTPMAYQDLVNAGADAVKVGIGPGAACTTRMVTGFGVPQFTAIQDCNEVAKKLRAPLIADGGIRNSRDVALALAAGASTVMIGKLFALTVESPAEKRKIVSHDPSWSASFSYEDLKNHYQCYECKYRGQASKDFQEDFKGGLKKGTVPEGDSFWAPVSGPVEDVVNDLLGGLRSAMTYGGARSIKEFQNKAEFVEVTSNYLSESNTRKK